MRNVLRRIDERFERRLPAFRRFIAFRFKKGGLYGRDFTIALLAVIASMWLFVRLVDVAATDADIYYLDLRIQTLMLRVLNTELTGWFIFITFFGGTRGVFLGVVIVGTFLLLQRRWWGLFGLLFATGGGGLVMQTLKLIFRRPRPVEQIIDAGGYAFPSGHAFASLVFFGYIIYLAGHYVHSRVARAGVVLFCLAMILLIGTSRIYLNVHWLTDVLGGYLSGLIWLLASILIVRHIEWQPIGGYHEQIDEPVAEDSGSNVDRT